ncbi:unnamed protein product, partial [Ectocarpus sp. 8 AP-2014]
CLLVPLNLVVLRVWASVVGPWSCFDFGRETHGVGAQKRAFNSSSREGRKERRTNAALTIVGRVTCVLFETAFFSTRKGSKCKWGKTGGLSYNTPRLGKVGGKHTRKHKCDVDA